MSDYYWPNHSITDLHKDYIFQVLYTYSQTDDPTIIKIKQLNHHDTVPTHTHRGFLPKFYEDHVCRFFWRYYLLIQLYQNFQSCHPRRHRQFLQKLIKIIVHLNNVIESIIRPCLQIPIENMGLYRSASFNEYLITEFLIGRHDPKTLQKFRKGCPINIECMDMARLDWKQYDDRLPPKLQGEKYSFDAEQIPGEDYEDLWDIVHGWYTCDLDTTWISSWVKWEEELPEQEQESWSPPDPIKGKEMETGQ
ncbi:hypothetical protein J3A83DRAFT_4191357 [Scleroderma citrinum]